MNRSERAKILYDSRKANGLCTKCGKERDGKTTYCLSCLEKKSAYRALKRETLRLSAANDYAYYKAHHICTDCRCRRAAPNRIRCEFCLAKRAESTAVRREKVGDKIRAYQQQVRAYRKENGFCVVCGTKLKNTQYLTCGKCLVKRRMYVVRRKQAMLAAETSEPISTLTQI